ncbi:MAG: hypothetical protein IT556_12265 [Acetobacteraceae bacterium]|nr:hypothetical protein [Acetobacteraceae bacterium]
MPVLAPGVAFRSRAPTLAVENTLEAGAWRFRLTVLDDAGNESAPAELVVQVRAPERPGGPVRPDLPVGGVVRPVDPRPLDPRPVGPRPVDPPIVQPVTPIRPVRPPG